MTALEVRTEYLNIASDKRSRTGERTPKWNRKIKGRKGIGKFAGLTIANHMEMMTRARGVQSTLSIDKRDLIDNQSDLEQAPLPFMEEAHDDLSTGTTIILSELDHRLNFPTPERLREVLIFEYGREDSFRVFVNDIPLSVSDVPGTTVQSNTELPLAGHVKLRFTVCDGKKAPKYHGILLKVDGKVVGKPMMFGLDEDDEIPLGLVKRVYGEVELTGIEDFVTADWGGVIENSRSYQEAKAHVREEVKSSLKSTHANELNLQKARLARQFKKRLEALPEHRRKYAEEALNRILKRFYGETDERISTIAEVALDAMEQDAYPAEGRRDAGYIWRMVRHLAKQSGVVGLHIDEAQHMFTDTGEAANRAMLDNFKSLMKDITWPMILILSGVPELARHLEKDRPTEDRRQLRFLLTPVHFEMINPVDDIAELNGMAYSYAYKAGVDFDALSEHDFFDRLIYACAYRWGLVIEMLIEAFSICVLSGAKAATREHFVTAFSRIYGLPEGFSPFTMPDYKGSFEPEKLLELLDRDR